MTSCAPPAVFDERLSLQTQEVRRWKLLRWRHTHVSLKAPALRGITYPDSLPVLDFLATDSVKTMPGWVQRHEDQLRNVRRHKVVVLDGAHYLHWTQSNAMAQMITDFIGQK